MLKNERGIGAVVWQLARGSLPYPDLPRRIRVRQASARMASRKPFPDTNATGVDAARIALLRALHLQVQTRRAVRSRNPEAAALLARSAVDACIIGLYCLYNEGAVKELDGAENRGVRRVLAFLPGTGLVSQETIDATADAMGRKGHDLKLGNIAEDLRTDHDVSEAANLYQRFYIPLSHFFAHSSESALTRHVAVRRTRKRAASSWTRRSPVRLADSCVGTLAGHLAIRTGHACVARFKRYADDHLQRAVPPASAAAVKGLARTFPWQALPAWITDTRQFRTYLRTADPSTPPAEIEDRARAFFSEKMAELDLGVSDELNHTFISQISARLSSEWAQLHTDGPDATGGH